MINKKFIFLFLVVAVFSNMFCMDKQPKERFSSPFLVFLDQMSSSNLMTNFARKLWLRSMRNLKSNSTYEALFNEAQKKVGIAEKDWLPVVDAFEDSNAVASTSSLRFTVNRNIFDVCPYSYQKKIALHEAMHHKYNENAFSFLTDTTTYLTSKKAMHVIINGIEPKNMMSHNIKFFLHTSPVVLSLLAAYLVSNKLSAYYEFRADREATKMLGCYKCVNVVQKRTEEHGCGIPYMVPHEYQKYIDEFEKENRLCEYHSKKIKVPITHSPTNSLYPSSAFA